MKNVIKISILFILSATLIVILTQRKLINFELIQYALSSHIWLICGVAFLQILNYIAMAARYKSILKILGFDKKTNNVFAATFVSNGIGQWLPGSLAFIEVIRVGLMRKTVKTESMAPCRSDKPLGSNETSQLAMASLFDRLIGLFVGLFTGSLVTFYFILTLNSPSTTNKYILYLTLTFNVFMCAFILMLPVIANSKLMQHFLAMGERFVLKFVSHSTFQNFIMKIFHKINGLIKLLAEQHKNYKLFFIPIVLSTLSMISFATSLQLASVALGTSLPFFITLAVISVLSIVVALPISIGGIGAPQLITAILFGAFGASSAMAASAQLLQTGITLITISLCALCYLPRMIKEMIRPRIA